MAANKELTLNLLERIILVNVVKALPTPGTMSDVIAAGRLVEVVNITDEEIKEHEIVEDNGMLRWKLENDFSRTFHLNEAQAMFLVRLMDVGVWPYQYPKEIEQLAIKLGALR